MHVLILTEVLDELVAALCLCFARLGYRMTCLSSVSADEERRWQAYWHGGKCDVQVLRDDATANEIGDAIPPVSEKERIWIIRGEVTQVPSLMQQTIAPQDCIIHLVEKRDAETATLPAMPSTQRSNTIRIGHIGPPAQERRTPGTPFDQQQGVHNLSKCSGQSYEVAVLSAFLASSEARHINGAVFDVHTGRYLS
ncbi:MAG: hypothetical protein REI95_14450 [Oxalicibacterium faecigallinarum]|uniref:hypothetical protein n=1 Tax=Oxalicibacterium faecigallinarum TaxID=573741 RepID=UPI00280934DE|nr:hypothetical protein [Oxalicibacterium faecigallinarum]MDQ7970830.1 hypothetical protein [Oxalicibacterium faecigallinarum]